MNRTNTQIIPQQLTNKKGLSKHTFNNKLTGVLNQSSDTEITLEALPFIDRTIERLQSTRIRRTWFHLAVHE